MSGHHVSVEPFHPGEYLQEELSARLWTGHVLAEKMGVRPEEVAMVLARMGDVTPEFAEKLCKVFEGQNPETWLNLQESYRRSAVAMLTRDLDEVLKASEEFEQDAEEMRQRAFQPDWVSHPGNTLRELFREHPEVSVEEAAVLAEVEPHDLGLVMSGQAPVTNEIAAGLAIAFGGSVEFWKRRQSQYEADCKRLGIEPNRGE